MVSQWPASLLPITSERRCASSCRGALNRPVLLSFGLTSAAGGVAGALMRSVFHNVVLTIIFGGLLVQAGMLGLAGLSEKMTFKGAGAWLVGSLSGLFGGLVRNKGGIRAAALLGFKRDRDQFVATGTGIALHVDPDRVPFYLSTQWTQLVSTWQLTLVASVAVLAATLGEKGVLEPLPQRAFKKVASSIILAVGILVLAERYPDSLRANVLDHLTNPSPHGYTVLVCRPN